MPQQIHHLLRLVLLAPTHTLSSSSSLLSTGTNQAGHSTKQGVHSIFTYNSNSAEADKLIAEVSETGAQAIAIQLDTGKISTFDPFVKSVAAALAEMGAERFDYLVNNAGTSHHAPFDKVTGEDFDSRYNVHFKGVFFLT